MVDVSLGDAQGGFSSDLAKADDIFEPQALTLSGSAVRPFFEPVASSFAAAQGSGPGTVVVVVLVVVLVVVVQPTTPIMPALFSGVGGHASAKSATLLLVEPVRVRLCDPSPGGRLVGVPEDEL